MDDKIVNDVVENLDIDEMIDILTELTDIVIQLQYRIKTEDELSDRLIKLFQRIENLGLDKLVSYFEDV